ncbi:MAG: hypothetical protein ACI4HO_00995 [Ruminococcus sp.]
MNTNLQTNPYQQNVDILKGFFKRPIVLVTAILTGVSTLLTMFSGLFTRSAVNSYVSDYFNSMPYEVRKYISEAGTPSTSINISLPVLTILLTVALFLFYFFSKNDTKNLAVPTTMFKVISIIELVFVCVAGGILLVALLIVMIGFSAFQSYIVSNNSQYTTAIASGASVLLIVALILFAIIIGLMIWYFAVKVKFACSIKKSTNSINLFRNGAKMFGVLTIIFSCISGIYVLAILSIPGMAYVSFSGLVGVAANISLGVTAIQYANYIKDVSVNFATQPAYSPVNPEPFSPQNVAQPPYGVPYTEPVQPVNPVYQQPSEPQPVAPVEQAPETNAYEPVENATEEVVDEAPTEEAPVVETTSFCSACGNPVKADDYFCNNCGNKLK